MLSINPVLLPVSFIGDGVLGGSNGVCPAAGCVASVPGVVVPGVIGVSGVVGGFCAAG